MNKITSIIPSAALYLSVLVFNLPLSAAEHGAHDSTQTKKAAGKDEHGHNEAGHDHSKHDQGKYDEKASGHKAHGKKTGHGHKAVGLGKTDIREISLALRENLACMEKEMSAPNHDIFHGCLENIGSLGQDLIALKVPVEPAKKKRVNGYARNLDQMTHKVDEHMDAGHSDKALDQLKKLKTQVEMIEGQFPELMKK